MKKLFLFVALSPLFALAQKCSCEDHLKWVKKTFEENDAGFQYAIDLKGKQAYEKHNDVYFAKVRLVKAPLDCTKLLYEWLTFFRNGHIGIVPKSQPAIAKPGIQPSANWEKVVLDTAAFRTMLNGKKKQDLEGIWVTPPYTIGVKKGGTGYLGFIIASDAPEWKPGEVKFRIDTSGGSWQGTFYMRDRTPVDAKDITMISDRYIEFDRFTLQRSWPALGPDPMVEGYYQMIGTANPYLDSLDPKTLYLRIPSFDLGQKQAIDSVVNTNRARILRTENLVIDLRGNGGGADDSYSVLSPLLYTNPIRTVGTTFYSTPLNNKRMLDFINDPKYGIDEDGKKWAKRSYDKLQQHLGEFISLNENPISIDKYDTVFPFPKHVGVIIHGGNGSTTEQFLLEARQSAKVKLFGTTTMGVLDVSNMYFVDDPCGVFQLGYSLSKSYRIPDMAIDGKGISPDVYMDKTIPKYEWVERVRKYLDGQ